MWQLERRVYFECGLMSKMTQRGVYFECSMHIRSKMTQGGVYFKCDQASYLRVYYDVATIKRGVYFECASL